MCASFKRIFWVVAIAMAVSTPIAQAEPVTLGADYVGQWTSLSSQFDLVGYRYNVSTSAGMFKWVRYLSTSANTGTYSTDVDAGGIPNTGDPADRTFSTFCIQLTENVRDAYNSSIFEVTDDLASAPIGPGTTNAPMGSTKAGALKNLYAQFFDETLFKSASTSYTLSPGVTYTGKQAAAAFQYAVWEIVWEDWTAVSQLNVLDGPKFDIDNPSNSTNVTEARKLANAWLAEVDPDAGGAKLKALVSRSNQDQVFFIGIADAPPTVPLPASVYGGLALLAGVLGVRQYQRRSAR